MVLSHDVEELDAEDSQRLQYAVRAILDLVHASHGLNEKHFRRLLAERGFNVASTEEALRH